MTRFELIIELNGAKQQLDTYNEEPISLTYNVADVNDIASRNSSFSKTIKLPETRNNRSVFGDISDLGVNSTFNPNKKTKAWILVDTAVVFEGYLQLRKAIVNKETEQTDYEVVIYADNDNFYKQLGDDFISDMDFSELDHIWSKDNIVKSFTASATDGYYYPLIDYGQDWDLGEVNGWTTTYNTEVKVRDMLPATNTKYIFDKIFSLAGYNYQSNFLTGDVFKNLYIPFNKTGIVRNVSTSNGRFTVGLSQSLTYNNGTIKNTARTILGPGGGPGGGGATPIPNPFPVALGATDDRFHIPFNYEASPNGDPDNLYNWSSVAPNVDTYFYEAPVGFIAEQFVCNFDIRFPYGINYNGNKHLSSDPLASICFRRSRNPITGATVSGGLGYVVPIGGSLAPKRFISADIPGITYAETGGGYTPIGGKVVRGQISCDILDGSTPNTRKLYPGERLWVEVKYNVPANTLRAQGGMIDATSGTTPIWRMPTGTSYPLITFNPACNFFNILSSIVSVDETIPYNSVIPSNVKKKDFINSIIKMFNLYVEPSKDYARTLIIEPRDEYYQGGAIKDWTRKLNTNTNVEEQILGETQNKKTIWKYKEDKDYFNGDYTTTTGGLSYGEYNYYIDNDFTTGEKKIDLIFSPTPIVAIKNPGSLSYSELIIPKIVKVETGAVSRTDSNIRILTRYYSSTKSPWIYGDFQFNSSSGFYNAYVKLTSLGFGNALHSFKVGDYIKVAQADGGASKPLLQANFKIVEIVNTRTIVIDIPFSYVGSGAAIGGTCYPLDGLLGVNPNSTWSFEGSKFRAYPYLGHLDDPLNPSYDINFGQTLGLYYPQTRTTNNNLFNIYWENFINELSNKSSRIITAEFYLTPYDIANFRFNDNIYIRDQYYKVNKINNYDPTKETTVKVELIKTEYITVPRARLIVRGDIPIGFDASFTTVQLRPYVSTGGVLTTSGNTPLGSGTIISGRNNTGSGLIVGRDNVVGALNTMTIGNNNNLNQNTDGSVVVGDRNIISAGNNNLPKFILGSDNTHAGDGIIIGQNNNIGIGNINSHVFGSNNNISSPYTDVVIDENNNIASEEPKNLFVIGDDNVISSPTYSALDNIFIHGRGSTVSAPNVSVFGNNADLGTNSSGAYIIGDNVFLNDPDTFVVNKPTSIITSLNLEVSSKTTFTESVRIVDTVNNTQAVSGSGFTSFLKLADFPTEAGAFTGETIEGVANNAVSSGQVGYLDGLGKWLIATSDDMFSAQEGGSQLGVIIHGASASDTTTILLRGFYSPGDYLRPETGFAIGQPLYIAPSSAGQGFITNLVPSTGNTIRIVGYLHDENPPYTVRFSPDNTWIDLD
jgi:hypothetical protein